MSRTVMRLEPALTILMAFNKQVLGMGTRLEWCSRVFQFPYSLSRVVSHMHGPVGGGLGKRTVRVSDDEESTWSSPATSSPPASSQIHSCTGNGRHPLWLASSVDDLWEHSGALWEHSDAVLCIRQKPSGTRACVASRNRKIPAWTRPQIQPRLPNEEQRDKPFQAGNHTPPPGHCAHPQDTPPW
jgi:hypothetical protein